MQTSQKDLNSRKDTFRAKKTDSKSKIPTKLDVGCCFRKPEGYWGTDVIHFTGVDQVFDHTKYPWPLPENHFEEIRLWHIMQYLPDTEATMKEIWRIAASNAKIIIGVPYFMSLLGFGDRNKAFFTERTFDAFTENSWYAEEKKSFTSGAKFEITYQKLRTTGKYRKFIPFKGFFRHFLWNIIDEMEIHLKVKK